MWKTLLWKHKFTKESYMLSFEKSPIHFHFYFFSIESMIWKQNELQIIKKIVMPESIILKQRIKNKSPKNIKQI